MSTSHDAAAAGIAGHLPTHHYTIPPAHFPRKQFPFRFPIKIIEFTVDFLWGKWYYHIRVMKTSAVKTEYAEVLELADRQD